MPRGRPRRVVSETIDKNVLDDMIVKEDDSSVEDVESRPSMSDPKWNDYVLGLLTDDEFDERVIGIKLPKTDGLGRVVRLIFGEILESEPDVVVVSPEMIIVKRKISVPLLSNPSIMISFTGLADATPENSDSPYSKFLTAVADTRARGRAYREILGLKNVAVAEELSEKAESDVMITSAQKAAMKNLTNQLNIDVLKFINMDGDTYNDVDKISKNNAARMLEKLNNYKTKKEDIRIDILKGE